MEFIFALLFSIPLIFFSIFVVYLWVSFCFASTYKVSFLKGMKMALEEFKEIFDTIIDK